MAAQPKPKAQPPAPQPGAGVPQEAFADAAASLATKLGWGGPGVEDDWVQNDIQVSDARAYIQRVMHEHHQAAARGLPQPDYRAACEHLAVDTPEEQAAIDEALRAAYESGEGKTYVPARPRAAELGGELAGTASQMLGGLERGATKAGG